MTDWFESLKKYAQKVGQNSAEDQFYVTFSLGKKQFKSRLLSDKQAIENICKDVQQMVELENQLDNVHEDCGNLSVYMHMHVNFDKNASDILLRWNALFPISMFFLSDYVANKSTVILCTDICGTHLRIQEPCGSIEAARHNFNEFCEKLIIKAKPWLEKLCILWTLQVKYNYVEEDKKVFFVPSLLNNLSATGSETKLNETKTVSKTNTTKTGVLGSEGKFYNNSVVALYMNGNQGNQSESGAVAFLNWKRETEQYHHMHIV